jgi:hypothetical protein
LSESDSSAKPLLRLPDVREVELVDVQVDGGQVVTWRAEDVEQVLGNTTETPR